MNDQYENAKSAARLQMMRESDDNKRALIREIKEGLGKQIVEELEKEVTKPKISLLNKIKKVLGL
jgi:hypothetical protein